MEYKKIVKFNLLLLMIKTNWITTTSMITFTEFQKLSDGRFMSELGTTSAYSVETCIYLCIKTPSCLSVSYERVTKQCELGSNVPDMEKVTIDPDWVVYYKTGLNASPSGATGNFVLVDLVMPWNEANNYCHTTYSGHLVNIKTEAVMNQLIPLLDEHPHVMYAWAGATDSAEEGNWIWTDNTPVFDGYTRWKIHHPGNADCMMMLSATYHHEWQAVNCLTLLVSICQY